MLSERIASALNEQIYHEAYASHYYLAMASWCDVNGFEGGARFMFQHSDEERMHMLKLFHYINERGGKAITPSIKQPPTEFPSLAGLLTAALEHEVAVTAAIGKLVELCLEEKDYSTFAFIQWFVNEQHEEESLFRTILDKVKLLAGHENELYLIDKELQELAGASSGSA